MPGSSSSRILLITVPYGSRRSRIRTATWCSCFTRHERPEQTRRPRRQVGVIVYGVTFVQSSSKRLLGSKPNERSNLSILLGWPWAASDPGTVGYEPFLNRDRSQRATNNT